MITLIVLCVVVIVLVSLILSLLSIPFLLVGAVLPFLCALAGIVLLVKAAQEKPTRWENFIPGGIALLLCVFFRWIF